jgi:formylglycine-generating enzyme required for sulfatase activity
MAWIPAGEFAMGSEEFYPEERPVRRVAVDGFWMDAHQVTNAEFRRFVKATGYTTLAERAPSAGDYPDADPALLVPGSLVFVQPRVRVPLDDVRAWWRYAPGACWRRPEGPGSSLNGRERHPAVHVAYEDAEAYARWCGKALPTEAEWERAARGGLEGARFPWGDEFQPGGRTMANTWHGEFPWQHVPVGRFERTSPVGSFAPNGFGLFDVAGNVWEWTADAFVFDRWARTDGCCVPRNPRVDNAGNGATIAERRVIKGGSHLCAPNYCLRYRPAARQGETVDTSTSHLGFRCIVRPPAADGQA